MTHTPGPWHVESRDELNGYSIIGPNCEAVVYSSENSGSFFGIDNAADARLIAAAPDMLEALRILCDVADGWVVSATGGEVIDDARAAIAKATGGT